MLGSATPTSLRSLPTSTGCTYLSASSTSCAYWSTSAFRGPHRASCRTPSARTRVRNHGVACAPRHRPISSCRRLDVQQWAQDRAFAVAASRVWNSLPDAIRRSPSLAVFKRSLKTHFLPRCYASAVIAMGLCLCLSVFRLCLSVTSRRSTITAKQRITQKTPHNSPGTLVSDYKDLREIRPGSPTTRAPNAGGVGQNRRLSTNNRLYLENGKR